MGTGSSLSVPFLGTRNIETNLASADKKNTGNTKNAGNTKKTGEKEKKMRNVRTKNHFAPYLSYEKKKRRGDCLNANK
jgi:hypothetical protein